jgi:hypothetical protein
VRSRRKQEQVVRGVANQLAEPVAKALVRFVRRGHAVRLVHNDQVPVDLTQPGQDVLALRQIKRGDDPVLFEPLIHAELVADVLPFEYEELGIELFLQLALPLKSEVGGAYDQDTLGKAA